VVVDEVSCATTIELLELFGMQAILPNPGAYRSVAQGRNAPVQGLFLEYGVQGSRSAPFTSKPVHSKYLSNLKLRQKRPDPSGKMKRLILPLKREKICFGFTCGKSFLH
jgi:hypothetical protein